MKPELAKLLETVAGDLESQAARLQQHATFMRRLSAAMKPISGNDAGKSKTKNAGTAGTSKE